MSNMMMFAVAWGVLALIVLTLALMRKSVASHEDDVIHLTGDPDAAVREQTAVAKKLETLDKWGKPLTVVLAITGLVLAGIWGYDMFEAVGSAGFSK